MIPNTLTIAGIDPSGGAGILADIKTMSALGAYGTAVVAALTAQNTQTVTGISPVPPAFVAEQIDTLFADVRIDAVKIRSEEHTSELQSLMRISYAVFCLKKKHQHQHHPVTRLLTILVT